jgi:hypothetical protein
MVMDGAYVDAFLNCPIREVMGIELPRRTAKRLVAGRPLKFPLAPENMIRLQLRCLEEQSVWRNKDGRRLSIGKE